MRWTRPPLCTITDGMADPMRVDQTEVDPAEEVLEVGVLEVEVLEAEVLEVEVLEVEDPVEMAVGVEMVGTSPHLHGRLNLLQLLQL